MITVQIYLLGCVLTDMPDMPNVRIRNSKVSEIVCGKRVAQTLLFCLCLLAFTLYFLTAVKRL